MHLAHNKSPADIAQLLCISERTVRRYLTLFYPTGDVEPRPRTNGPKRLLGDFEQVVLLRLVLAYPGIYLHELQSELQKMFGVTASSSTICKTLKFMGCTRQCMHHIALQRSDTLRAQFLATISIYDPSMIVWLDESSHDRRNTIRKQAYSFRGMPLADHRILAGGI